VSQLAGVDHIWRGLLSGEKRESTPIKSVIKQCATGKNLPRIAVYLAPGIEESSV
jgi:hypothetical protein